MTLESPSNRLELVKQEPDRKVPSPGVLKRIEEDALTASKRLLAQMFSATDDLFYELSKRASSNNEQNLYFESMREIRVKKDGVILAFQQIISSNFDELLTSRAKPKANDEKPSDVEVSLSIVEGDDLEIDLALKSMSNRARESFKNELYELAVRLDHLLLQSSVDANNNPLDPRQIAKAFVTACIEKLAISIKTRLILFKLFEKHVLKQLGHVYMDANRTLIETGILPKVPKNVVKPTTAQSSPPVTDSSAHEPSTQAQQPAIGSNVNTGSSRTISLTPEALASLMAAIRSESRNNSGINYYLYGGNPGPIIPKADLTRILTTKQPIVDHKIARSHPRVVLRELVKELLVKNNPEAPNALAQSEEDTINLVAMFFDKILEDRSLPLVVQSLVCRLQIPILKVALRDRNFLSDAQHPARKLINTITTSGIQFDESKPLERDPLYRTIVDGIQIINRQYKADDSVFSTVQAELDELIKTEAQRAKVVESRTNQTELGKAKIRNAKIYAQSSLFKKLREQRLPASISQFLTNTWLQVLVITYIKDGKDGALWIENEQLISDLIWLCKGHQDERSKARVQRLKPEILARIETGLKLAIDNPDTRKMRIDEIEGTIDALIAGEVSPTIALRELDTEQKEILGKAPGAEKTWEEMTALERQQTTYEELSSKYFSEAKDIPDGTWIEYQKEDGSTARCKLSKKIDADTYIFVNRLGFKVLEKSRRDLAYDMQFTRVKILDNSPVFDRILSSIVSPFQRSQTAAEN